MEKRIEVSRGNIKKISIERKEQNPILTLSITRIAPESIKKEVKTAGKQIPIKVILKDFISNEDLKKYNKRISYIEPKNFELDENSDLLKVGCHISCFRQNNKIWYRLNIRHRIFEEIFNRKMKIALCRKENYFLIEKDEEGKEFRFYKGKEGHPLAYMQISPEFLNEEEINLFKGRRRAVSFKAFLSAKDFGLDISNFFINKEERELAKALIKERIRIRHPEMRKREADIVLDKENCQIEVTKVMPRINDKNKNTSHTEGVHISARFGEGFIRVKKDGINKFFIVFHKEWNKFKWINELAEKTCPEVIAISTDFKNNWAEEVAKKIKKEL